MNNIKYQHSVPAEILDLLDVQTRLRLYFVIENRQGSPNSDPNGNAPRVDVMGYGFISDVSIKRMIRDAAARHGESLYFERGANLADKKRTLEGVKNPCEHQWDLPLFGAVIKDRVRGALVIRAPRTNEPIRLSTITTTRTSTDSGKGEKKVNEDGTEDQGGGSMGNRQIVDYALYEGWAEYNPHQGVANGVTKEHLIEFIDAMLSGWEYNRSTARPGVNLRAMAVFKMPHNRTGEPAARTYKRAKLTVQGYDEGNTFDSTNVPVALDTAGLEAAGMKGAYWCDGEVSVLKS